MSQELVIHGFETSNNMKVRVALGFKEIPYRFSAIDPADREEILRLSGQYLTPVLEHDGRVLFDSAAILRYLEANFPGRPPLFGTTRDEQWVIEDHELYARHTLAAPMMELVHHRVAGGTVDATMRDRCDAAFATALAHVADGIRGRRWLVGDAMTAADVTAGAVIHRVRSSGLFEIGDLAEDVTSWVDRVMAHDAHGKRPESA